MQSGNDKQPLVSVIMPVYNCEKYVRQAIESIMNQTYTNWELLICDDGSTDCSYEKIINYSLLDKRVRIFKNKTNHGGAATRNLLISQSKGKIIALQDADDISSPNRIERQLYFLNINKLDGCCTGCAIIDTKGNVIEKSNYVDSINLIRWSSYFKISLCNPTLLIYKKHLDIINGYNIAFKTESEDFDLITRLLDNLVLINNCPDILYYYRKNPNSVSYVKKDIQKFNSFKISNNRTNNLINKKVSFELIEFNKYYHLGDFYFRNNKHIPIHFLHLFLIYKCFKKEYNPSTLDLCSIKLDLHKRLLYLALVYRKKCYFISALMILLLLIWDYRVGRILFQRFSCIIK